MGYGAVIKAYKHRFGGVTLLGGWVLASDSLGRSLYSRCRGFRRRLYDMRDGDLYSSLQFPTP